MSSQDSVNKKISTKKRGRPRKNRKARQIKASDYTWKKLREEIIPDLPSELHTSNISDLLDNIANEKLKVVSQGVSGIPIYRRLSILFQEPAYIFESLISFSSRLTQQVDEDSQIQIKEQVDTLLKATTVTFAVGYIHPDVFINNPSAYMRWLISNIVEGKIKQGKVKEKAEAIPQEENNDSINPQAVVKQIANAISSLENSLSGESKVFKARIIGGLSTKQLRRIFELEEEFYSEFEIGMMLKKAIKVFRDKYYPDADNEKFSEPANTVYEATANKEIKKRIIKYYELASKSHLSGTDLKTLQEITDKARHHAYLDTFINEIDYIIAQKNELNHQSQIRQLFNQEFTEKLKEKKQAIDTKLRHKRRRTVDFWGSVEDLVKQEIGKEIEIKELLKQEAPISPDKLL